MIWVSTQLYALRWLINKCACMEHTTSDWDLLHCTIAVICLTPRYLGIRPVYKQNLLFACMCLCSTHDTLQVAKDDFLCPASSQFSYITSCHFSCTRTCNGSDDNDCCVDDHCCAGWSHWCCISTQKMKVWHCPSSSFSYCTTDCKQIW